MFPTVEVRWFYEGAVPADVADWFRRSGHEAEEQPPRVDTYLRLEGGGLGVKLRQGQIEIKQRHREYGVTRFHERIAGAVEHWRKWGFPLAEGNHVTRALTSSASWVRVNKARLLRRYELGDGRAAAAASTGEYPAQGCDWELTRITAAGREWWSVSFEAFGDERNLRANFTLVAKHVLAAGSPPTLAVEHSYGYPRWLELIR